MALLLLPIVLILYVAAAGAFIAYLVSARERLRELAPLLLAAAAALHGFEIAGRSFGAWTCRAIARACSHPSW